MCACAPKKSNLNASACSVMGCVLAQAVDAQNGNLALHIAAQNGHMNLTSFLLDSRGPAVTQPWTPPQRADLLQGANVNAQNFNGQTALHMSVEYESWMGQGRGLAVSGSLQSTGLHLCSPLAQRSIGLLKTPNVKTRSHPRILRDI